MGASPTEQPGVEDESAATVPVPPRMLVRQLAAKAITDRAAMYAVLDAGRVAHVDYSAGERPPDSGAEPIGSTPAGQLWAGSRLTNLVGALALSAVDAIQRATEAALPGHASLAPALVVVATFESTTVDELAGALNVTHSGAVRVADRLESAGWARRLRWADRGDARTVGLRLTPRGQRAVRNLLVARERALESLLAPLSRDERLRVEKMAEKVLGSLAGSSSDLRRICRLCDHGACKACPTLQAVERQEVEGFTGAQRRRPS